VAGALIEGLRFSGATRAHERYLDAHCNGRTEPFAAELFARSAHRGATVIDGGAYLGFYALLAARRIGSDGRVFAFEPNPETFEMLRGNVSENGLEDQVVPLAGECSDLDATLGAGPVDLVRLDLGGGEVEALRGMRRTLASSPDPCLIVDCGPSALARAGTSPRTLLRELDAAELEVYAIDEQHWELHPMDEVLVAGGGHLNHLNLYCRRP
jgi:hypothetical protein